nr:right-handed parallel beta-helix repeat-containing protein [Eubacterium sp.]
MKTLLFMTLSGSLLSLLLLALRYKALKKMPSTVYYYAWLLVLLRFAIPFPGLIPAAVRAKTHEVHTRTVFVSNVRRTNNDLTRNTVSSEKEKTSFIPSKTAQADMGDDAPAQEIISEKTPVRRIHWIAPGFWIMLWAFGTILSMALTMLAYLRFILHIRHSLHRIDSHTRELYDSIPGRKPALFYSDQVHTPMMFGVFSPKIVLPERACDEEMLHNILRHELMHYRRFDTLYKWFAVTVLSAHWFNPLSMIARRELNRACELSCDEMLLRSMSLREKRSYGNTLLSMAASALPAGVVATTFATQKRDLKERLVQIMNYKKSGTRIVTAALAVLLLSGCCMAAGLKTEAESPDDISPDAGSVTTVSNVDEFLAAIAPDTTIILKDGEYDLSTAANYCAESDNPYYAWEEVWDDEGRTHAELVISGADGLTIEGEGMDQTVIRAVPRYANVIRFAGCSDLTVRKLTAGHTEAPGLCAGGVLMIESCSNVSVADCGLYGCGTVGVDGWYTNNLSVTGCKIYECSCEAVNLFYCRDAMVEQCSVYRHGIRDGQDPAMAVFNINSSDDILIHDNDVYENNAQYLLSQSYTRNAVFLSNKIHDNRFEYSVFLFDQYGAAVDGCAFTDNDTFGSFVQGSGAFAYDVSGNLLEESDLASMTFREIDPETTAVSSPVSSAVDVEPGGSIEVTTIDEFLAAIGPDRTIILDGKEFDLSAASNYGTVGGEY